MIKSFLVFFLLLANTLGAASIAYPTAAFFPVMSFSSGSDANQLAWNHDENGMVIYGPFQGPMAFAFDQNDNLFICDSLNGRLLQTDKSGKTIAIFDLVKLTTDCPLENPIAIVDIACAPKEKMICADAANNAIIELDLKTKKCRTFFSPSGETGNDWTQINHVHTDNAGNIYIEDVARQKTQIIDHNGSAVKSLPGHLQIAVAGDAVIAMVMNDEKFPQRRAIYTSSAPGEDMRLLAAVTAKEPILWAGLLGYDQAGNLMFMYDTQKTRIFTAFNRDGEIVKNLSTSRVQHGYEPNRPYWQNKEAEVFTVRISHPKIEILKLR